MNESIPNHILHNVIIQDRKSISMTGITDVGSFDEETLNIETDSCRITVRGQNLQITNLNLDSGELSAEGEIISLMYSAASNKGKGLFSKMFG